MSNRPLYPWEQPSKAAVQVDVQPVDEREPVSSPAEPTTSFVEERSDDEE